MNEILEQAPTSSERSVSEITTSLVELLHAHGAVAYVVGLKQARTVKGWAEGGVTPANPAMESRLRVAENLAKVVQDPVRPWVSRAWLISCNPHLQEDSPSNLIQTIRGTGEDESVIARLQDAAEQFATN